MHAEEQYAVNLLRAGASGFFPKAGEAKDLLEAIRTVAAGRKYISPSLAEVLALEASGNAPEPPHRQLSNREFQIFVQLACGKTVTQIAERSASVRQDDQHLSHAHPAEDELLAQCGPDGLRAAAQPDGLIRATWPRQHDRASVSR